MIVLDILTYFRTRLQSSIIYSRWFYGQVGPLFNLIIFKELRNILLKFSTFTLGTHKVVVRCSHRESTLGLVS
jgi:hypothetical protein